MAVMASSALPAQNAGAKVSGTLAPLRLYGFLRLDANYDGARADDLLLPAYVLPENTTLGGAFIKEDDDAFAFDARLTRIGLDIDAGQVGEADATGKIELDFASFPSGVSESRAAPRLRLAYIDLDFGSYGLRAGQDQDVVSPLHPSTHSEHFFWNAGNLGDQRPQVQFRWVPDFFPLDYEIRFAAGLSGAIDNRDLDGGGTGSERDGFDSGMPHLQLRVGVGFDTTVDGKKAKAGVWGMFGRLETDSFFNRENRFGTWTVGADVMLPLTQNVTLRGEQWTGQALSDFRGGIDQSLNLASGQEIASMGGFGELFWQASENVSLHAGGSYDNPDRLDLVKGKSGSARRLRELNVAAYLGTRIAWGSGLETGLDVVYWETQWVDEGVGNMFRLGAYVKLEF